MSNFSLRTFSKSNLRNLSLTLYGMVTVFPSMSKYYVPCFFEYFQEGREIYFICIKYLRWNFEFWANIGYIDLAKDSIICRFYYSENVKTSPKGCQTNISNEDFPFEVGQQKDP